MLQICLSHLFLRLLSLGLSDLGTRLSSAAAVSMR